jgi:hypothetical protein
MVLKWSDGEQPTEILEYWSIGENIIYVLWLASLQYSQYVANLKTLGTCNL